MIGALPTKLEVCGKVYPINTDYRVILQIISAMNDDELKDSEKAYICLKQIYGDHLKEIPKEDYSEALKEAYLFIDYNPTLDNNKKNPKVVDWEQDEQLIFPAINKVAGAEVRAIPHVHWWTFLGWFQSIDTDGSVFGMVLTIRQKRSKHKKLEKWEKEFYSANKDICVIHGKHKPIRGKDTADTMDKVFGALAAGKEEGVK